MNARLMFEQMELAEAAELAGDTCTPAISTKNDEAMCCGVNMVRPELNYYECMQCGKLRKIAIETSTKTQSSGVNTVRINLCGK